MLVNFFHVLKDNGVPVTPRELLDLLEAMQRRLAFGDMDDFYSLSRAILVKDEKYYDRFDRAFGLHFQDLEALDDVIEAMIPDDWLRSEFMKQLSEEDKAKIESLGGLEELIEQFKERLEEQKKRHSGVISGSVQRVHHLLVTMVTTRKASGSAERARTSGR